MSLSKTAQSAFITVTLVLRILIFPVMLMATKNNIHLANQMPRMQRVTKKMQIAQESGNWISGEFHGFLTLLCLVRVDRFINMAEARAKIIKSAQAQLYGVEMPKKIDFKSKTLCYDH